MAVILNVSIDPWIYREIEYLKVRNNVSRSETVKELLIKGFFAMEKEENDRTKRKSKINK